MSWASEETRRKFLDLMILIIWVVEQENVVGLNWLIDVFKLEKDKIGPAFRKACQIESTNVLIFLVNKYNFTKTDKCVIKGFQDACGFGRFATVTFLVNEYGIDSNDVRSHKCNALFDACVNGHLEIANWLVDTFDLRRKDAMQDDKLICACCGVGKVEVVEFLFDKLGLTKEDTKYRQSYPIWVAYLRNHTELKEFFKKRFGLDHNDFEE